MVLARRHARDSLNVVVTYFFFAWGGTERKRWAGIITLNNDMDESLDLAALVGHPADVGNRGVSTEVASQRLNRQQGREFVNQPNAGGGGRILAVVVGAGQVGLSVF